MALYNSTELFKIVKDRQSYIPSFDVSGGNIDIINGIFSALELSDASAFISSTPHSIDSYYGIKSFVNNINEISNKYDVNYAIHLDHATNPEYVFEAIELGFTSVMYDGSHNSINDNIAVTKDIVNEAKKYGVTVEAELGIIGGKEDEITSNKSHVPDIVDCIRFVNETKLNIFAPAIGTIHGVYNNEPNISWDLVQELSDNISVPMALHGGSGLKDSIISKLIINGFKKINFATAIRQAFCDGIRKVIDTSSGKVIKPQKYLASGRQSVENFAMITIKKIFN